MEKSAPRRSCGVLLPHITLFEGKWLEIWPDVVFERLTPYRSGVELVRNKQSYPHGVETKKYAQES